jgi:hypothetical protein
MLFGDSKVVVFKRFIPAKKFLRQMLYSVLILIPPIWWLGKSTNTQFLRFVKHNLL